MLKIVSFVVLLAVIVDQSNAGPEEFVKILSDCKAAEKVSDADVTNFKNKVKPASKEVMCLTTCVAEKMGMLSNNQLSKDGCMKLAKAMPNANEKFMQVVSEVVEECKTIQNPDRCEFGAKVVDCIVEASGKRQLNLFM